MHERVKNINEWKNKYIILILLILLILILYYNLVTGQFHAENCKHEVSIYQSATLVFWTSLVLFTKLLTEFVFEVLMFFPTFRVKNSSTMSNTSLPPLTNPIPTEPAEESAVSNNYFTAIGALILSLVFLLGVPGNLFIVWSILARCRQRSVTTLLILNLACADGFLMALTIFFIIYLVMQTWVFGNAMCKILFYLCNSNMYASIFLITLMSVHRLLAVVFPHTLYRLITRKVVRRVILGTWMFVMVISIPSLVFRAAPAQNKTKVVCAPNHTLSEHVSTLVLAIFLPLIWLVWLLYLLSCIKCLQKSSVHLRAREIVGKQLKMITYIE